MTRGLVGLWAFVGVSLALLAGAYAFALYRFTRNPRPRFLSAPGSNAERPPRPSASARLLRLAGSGSNLPLTRKLAHAFSARREGATVVVHESIGSSGGIRAAYDGAVDLGLSSRPLTPRERRLNLTVIPYARVAVVLAANPTVPDTSLSRKAVLSIYAGRKTRWSDGSPVVVLQRERGDSSHLAFARAFPDFLRVDENARTAGRFKVLFSDSAMQEALMSTPGAVGLFDLGAIRSQNLTLKVLAVDGTIPSNERVVSGQYPCRKDLAIVSAGAPSGLALDFIRFVFSEQGRTLTAQNGYIPLDTRSSPARGSSFQPRKEPGP